MKRLLQIALLGGLVLGGASMAAAQVAGGGAASMDSGNDL